MIELEWKNQKSFLTLKHIRRIQALAKENKHLFYVAVPVFVYDHIKKVGINATIEVMEKELTVGNNPVVVLRISKEEEVTKHEPK